MTVSTDMSETCINNEKVSHTEKKISSERIILYYLGFVCFASLVNHLEKQSDFVKKGQKKDFFLCKEISFLMNSWNIVTILLGINGN